MSFRRGQGGYYRFLRPEPLEKRDLLAGHGFAAAFEHYHYGGIAAALAQQAGQRANFAAFSASSVHERIAETVAQLHGTKLSATLSDTESGAIGTMSYKTYTYDGETETELKVSVTGAAADSTLAVTVGTTVVGQLTTDANGAGSLTLSSNPEDGEEQLPDDFPAPIAAGTAVSVGTLTGTLDQTARGGGGCQETAGTRLHTTLSDADDTSASGYALFRASTGSDSAAELFTVKVRGAAADSTLDVSLGDTVVGQITTDSSGNGSLTLSSNPTGDQQQLPEDFPSVSAGMKVQVGTLSGTLVEASGHRGFRFGRFR